MLTLLIEKELKAILLSPKFSVTFGIASALIVLSAFLGIEEYQHTQRQFETAHQLISEEMRSQTSWMAAYTRAFREPNPMMIFVSGVQNDVGRYSAVAKWQDVGLRGSLFTEDTLFALFRSLDFVFIVQVVLSLFAILFTYDAINGEKENGTLQLTFANAVPRRTYLLAKFIGGFLGLVVPMLVPLLLAVLMALVSSAAFDDVHWLRLMGVFGVSLLYFTAFMTMGLLVSSLTHRSSLSFLVLLSLWILVVLIIPRGGMMTAAEIIPVPSAAEVKSKKDAFDKTQWSAHLTAMQEAWRKRSDAMKTMSEAERNAYRSEHEWEWTESDDNQRKTVEKTIADNARRLNEDITNLRRQQEKLGFACSRFSPASAYQLAVMTLAETDVDVKARYESALHNYREQFMQFVQRKQKESGGSGGIKIMIDAQSGVKVDAGKTISLDLAGMPTFQTPVQPSSSLWSSVMIDIGLLTALALSAFGAAFARFLRYDLR
jgi:ABC-type transport system involved in multi-copper enzyme maturation permease subunit